MFIFSLNYINSDNCCNYKAKRIKTNLNVIEECTAFISASSLRPLKVAESFVL